MLAVDVHAGGIDLTVILSLEVVEMPVEPGEFEGSNAGCGIRAYSVSICLAFECLILCVVLVVHESGSEGRGSIDRLP